MKSYAIMFAAMIAVSSTGARASEAEVVKAAVEAIVSDGDVQSVPGMTNLTAEQLEQLSGLARCKPSLAPGSNKSFVTIRFDCSSKSVAGQEGAVNREARFAFHRGKMASLKIAPAKAVGPTSAALNAEQIPSMDEQIKRLEQAVKNGGDVSLGGLLPLNQDQTNELLALGKCDWRKLSGSPKQSRSMIVKCRDGERRSERAVSLYFDDMKRATSVEVGVNLVKVPVR